METKRALGTLAFSLVFGCSAFGQAAQTPGTSKWVCRNLSDTGGYIDQNETVFGSKVCHQAAPVAVAQNAVTPASTAPIAQPAAAAQPDPSVAPAAATPVATASSVNQTQATIYLYRPKRFQHSALKPSVYVDDGAVGRLHNGDSVKVNVAPGTHRIYSNDKSTGMDLDAKAGQTYYVRVDIQLGFLKGHGGVTLVDPQQGTYEVGQLNHQSSSDKE